MALRLTMKVHCVLFIFLVVLISKSSGIDQEYFRAQERLIKTIMNKSEAGKEILPMADSSTPVRVRIGLGIRQIATVDEVNQALRLNVWLRLYWNNPFLAWEPEDYGNVTSVHLDNALMWTPDIAMYNKASLEEEIDILYKRISTSVILNHDGNCTWLCPVTLLSQCKINVRKFPFDEQNCPLIFGSWTYSVLNIDVASESADVDNFIPNGEWTVLEYSMKRNLKNYTAGQYPDVTLNFRIQRQPLYYTLNLILPCTVISILAFMSFVLPSNHGERISLVITVLLAMSVYMLIVSSTLPQTSDAIPVIGTYFLCIIVEIALCLLATCFVAKIQDHHSEMPHWFDKLVNKRLARFLFISNTLNEYDEVSKITSVNGHPKTLDVSFNEAMLTDSDIKYQQTANQRAVQKLHDELAVLSDDVHKKHKRDAKHKKWRRAAKVLDRFFLILFTFIFLLITASVFGGH